MSRIPADLRFLKSHEWARVERDGTLTVGITDFAQQVLGPLVFVEVPDAGRHIVAGEVGAVLESLQSRGEVCSPVGGSVIECNAALGGQPELVNTDPYGAGWIMRIRPDDKAQFAAMLDARAYAAALAAGSH